MAKLTNFHIDGNPCVAQPEDKVLAEGEVATNWRFDIMYELKKLVTLDGVKVSRPAPNIPDFPERLERCICLQKGEMAGGAQGKTGSREASEGGGGAQGQGGGRGIRMKDVRYDT